MKRFLAIALVAATVGGLGTAGAEAAPAAARSVAVAQAGDYYGCIIILNWTICIPRVF